MPIGHKAALKASKILNLLLLLVPVCYFIDVMSSAVDIDTETLSL